MRFSKRLIIATGRTDGELGDLLLQVLFYSEMAREAGHFSLG